MEIIHPIRSQNGAKCREGVETWQSPQFCVRQEGAEVCERDSRENGMSSVYGTTPSDGECQMIMSDSEEAHLD
jgi:hypothetical protein